MIFTSGDTGDVGGYTIANSLRLRSSASAYLSRTFASGTRTTWTWSGWAKRGALGTRQCLFSYDNSNRIDFDAADSLTVENYNGAGADYGLTSTALYRDPSAHYHVVVVWDTNNATAADRQRLYVNGSRVTSFSWQGNTIPPGALSTINNNLGHRLGVSGSGSFYLDGYLSDVYFIDGQALDPTYFGQFNTDGVWVPTAYSGTYGTNGFYLPFNDGSNLTNLCLDRSGNGNNWTATNVSLTAGATYDWTVDTPTCNYATLNPIGSSSNMTLASGNLNVTSSVGAQGFSAFSTIAPSSGKWYAEVLVVGGSVADMIGVAPATVAPSSRFDSVSGGIAYAQNGNKYVSGAGGAGYGASYTTNDLIGIALDLDTKVVTFYKNNISQGQITSAVISGVPYCFATADADGSFGINQAFNFGQRPFTYAPPAGFKALCTANLPAVTIPNPSDHHEVLTLTKSGNTNFTIPWDATLYDTYFEIKRRDAAGDWYQIDGLRGYDKVLKSNGTAAETTDANVLGISGTTGTLKSTLPDGTYVVSMWKAGLVSARQTNTEGSITSTVSANVTAGFSIATFNGTNVPSSVGHGLGLAPAMYTVKQRGATGDFFLYHKNAAASPALGGMSVNLTNAFTVNTYWNNSSPSSTVFSLGSSIGGLNANGVAHVAYCHAEVPGYSKFGSFACNASAAGPLGYLGFTAKSLELKAATNASNWFDWDTVRSLYNPMGANGEVLFKNTTGAEGSSGYLVDANAGTFKVRTAGGYGYNESGQTTVFMAYAKHPFGGSGVAPATAR